MTQQIFEKYRDEFVEMYEEICLRFVGMGYYLQQKLMNFNRYLESIEPHMKSYNREIVSRLQDQEPVMKLPSNGILQVFSWIFVLHLGYFFAQLAGAFVFHPLIGLFFGTFLACASIYLILPIYLLVSLGALAESESTDKDIRHRMLVVAVGQGVLTGYLFHNRHLVTMSPWAFVGALAVAFAAEFVAPNVGASRLAVLGSMVGTGFASHLFVGISFGQLSIPYVLLASLYALIAYIVLQFYLKYNEINPKPYLYIFAFFLLSLYAELVVLAIFGIPYGKNG